MSGDGGKRPRRSVRGANAISMGQSPLVNGAAGKNFPPLARGAPQKRTSKVRRCGGVQISARLQCLPPHWRRHARRLCSVQCTQWSRGKHTRLTDARCTSSTQLLFPTPPPFHFTLWHPCPSLYSSITSLPPPPSLLLLPSAPFGEGGTGKAAASIQTS